MDLNSLFTDPHAHFRSKQLRHRRLFGCCLPLVFHPGGAIHQQARGIDLRGHIGQLELNRLELTDWLSELLPLAGISQRRFVSSLSDTHSERRYGNSAAVE